MRSLAIDDEYVALNKLVTILEPLGPCDAATSGMQAIALFVKSAKGNQPYDLITIDINLPDMSGITLLGRFRGEEKTLSCPQSRKIVITAEATPLNVRAALAGDCDGFVVKPIDRNVFLDKLVNLGLMAERPS